MPGKVPPPYPPEVRLDTVRMVRELGASLQEVADSSAARSRRCATGSSRPILTTGCAPTA